MPDELSSSQNGKITTPYAAPLIDVRLDAPAWAEALPEIETLAREVAFETLRRAGPADSKYPTEISLMFTDDENMQALNFRFRNKNQTTNVLSFPSHNPRHSVDTDLVIDGTLMLGDVILAFGQMWREADGRGISLSHHVMHLITHGVLHLLGHDHEGDEEALSMEKYEAAILLALGADHPNRPDHSDQGASDHV